MRHGIERMGVAAVAGALGGLPLVHGLAALARAFGGGEQPLAAVELALAPVLAAVVALAASASGRRGAVAAAGAALTVLAAGWLARRGATAAAGALGIGVPLQLAFTSWLARRLPASLDGARARRPALAALWALAAVAALGQSGRMAAFMTDDSLAWGPVLPDYFAHHMCLPAYLGAAEMNAAGEPNVYDSAHYPGVARDARPTTAVEGMERYVEDPYQYPPQFLLLPHAALAVTGDFQLLRTGWFALQALGFLAAGALLARWIGGRRGRLAGLLFPVVFLSMGTMFNFQYGQFHLAALVLAVGGMLAFERRLHAAGGALLAAAILAKLFPAVLLVPLAVGRRWRALGATAAFAAAYTAAALAVLGTAPFEAFVAHHLPRLLDGRAFQFAEAWPELAAELAAGNQSPVGLAQKLGFLGVDAPAAATRAANALYTLAVLVVAVVGSRRVAVRGGRGARALLWLGLLGLAAHRSPGAWAEYLAVSSLWMLSIAAVDLRGSRARTALLAAGWVLLFFLPGIVPLPALPPAPAMMVLSILGFAATVLVNGWAVLRPAAAPEASRAGARTLASAAS